MCLGTAGFRTFPNLAGSGKEDAPNLRLQPSLSAPVADAGVLSLPQGKPPIPPSSPVPGQPTSGLPGFLNAFRMGGGYRPGGGAPIGGPVSPRMYGY